MQWMGKEEDPLHIIIIKKHSMKIKQKIKQKTRNAFNITLQKKLRIT